MTSRRRPSHNIEQRPVLQSDKRRPLVRRFSPSIPALPTEPATPSPPTQPATPSPPTQPTTALSAGPSSSTSGPPGVSLPPHGVAAVVGIVVMLSLAVFGFGGWWLCVYRKKKRAVRSPPSDNSRKPVGLFDAVNDEGLNIKRTLSATSADTIAIPPKAGDKGIIMTGERIAAHINLVTYQPKVIYEAPGEKTGTINTVPNIKATLPPPGLEIMPPPVYVTVPPPALSPRTGASLVSGTSRVTTASKLPRMVIVESTFASSLHDELEVREGETLQLLEEYEDEWCLVQRVGPKAVEKGVIPRFCVVDPPQSTT